LDAADYGVNGIDANEACCSTCDGFQPATVCASCIRPWRARKWERLLELTVDGSGVYSGIQAQPGGRENFVFWADSRDARAAWLFGGARSVLSCVRLCVAVVLTRLGMLWPRCRMGPWRDSRRHRRTERFVAYQHQRTEERYRSSERFLYLDGRSQKPLWFTTS